MSEERIRADVDELCDFAGRLAGTDAERRACNHVAEKLRASGRSATVEPTYVQPQWAFVHLLTCALAVVGSTIADAQPLAGFIVVLVAATSAYLDLSARHYLIRRLPFRRASQNVHTLPAEIDGPTLIICANADAPRTGLVYARTGAAIANRLGRRFPVVSSGTRIWFWSIALLLPALGARLAGFEPDWIGALQLPQTLILIVACFLLGEIALSPASPGANANASGVAGLLETLRRIDAEPPEHLRVEAVVAGAGETTMQGMRAFVRSNRARLAKDSTWFLSLEEIGRGGPRFVVSQGPAVSLPMDRGLSGLFDALAEENEDGDERRAEPMRDGRTSAAFVARAYGYRALPLTSREPGRALPSHHHTPDDLPEEVDPGAIAAVADMAADAIRLLDRDLGRAAKADED
ncbi:MAG: M28 family metallopeptidase [Solirubrobacterales bacterium]|nr:M28 family peptidase [Thermoleophilales bacterium]MCO5327957.1 M28 family metallopeptidase [Solirubrobacterales bacterium]